MGTLENVLRLFVEPLALAAEFFGAAAITVSVGYTLLPYIQSLHTGQPFPAVSDLRLRLGRGLVLGLEFLIGAHVLRTVLDPSLHVVAILGVMVLLRTVLALSMEFETRRSEPAPPQPVLHAATTPPERGRLNGNGEGRTGARAQAAAGAREQAKPSAA